jgi:hypothetical protein
MKLQAAYSQALIDLAADIAPLGFLDVELNISAYQGRQQPRERIATVSG